MPALLTRLALEDRLKIIDQAADVLDRSGWIKGSMCRVVRQTNEILGYCALGAMHEAAVELGYLKPADKNPVPVPNTFLIPYVSAEYERDGEQIDPYREIQDVMGWTTDQMSAIHHENDARVSQARVAALEVARKITRGETR